MNLDDYFRQFEFENNMNLTDIMFEISPNPIVITNPQADIIYANKSFVSHSERKLEDLLGQNMRLFKSGLTSDRVYSNMRKTLHEYKTTWSGVFRNMNPSGKVYFEKNTIVPIFDVNSELVAYVAFKSDITEIETLETKVNTDCLTSLPNLHALDKNLGAFMNEAEENGSFLTFMYMDLDGFKQINDKYGHSVGDEILKSVSKRFMSSIRDTDFVARVGGDEFVCVLQAFKDSDETVEVSERIARSIVRKISNSYRGENFQLQKGELGVSLGGVCYPNSYGEAIKSGKDLSDLADSLMYDVKKNGKNNYKILK